MKYVSSFAWLMNTTPSSFKLYMIGFPVCACVWCICIYLCMDICTCMCMCVYIEARGQYWVFSFLFLQIIFIFQDRTSHWSWDSLTGWTGWPVSSRICSSISISKALGLQTCVSPCPTFIWVLGIPIQVLMLVQWTVNQRNHLPSLRSSFFLMRFPENALYFLFTIHWLKGMKVYFYNEWELERVQMSHWYTEFISFS